MIGVLLVDDHAYIRKGIQYLLETITDMEVVATAANGIEAIAKARLHQPDVVVIDISMPFMSGIEAIKQICECCPRTQFLALSIYPDKEYVESALQAGAHGYVLKDEMGDELLEAIRSIYGGRQYFSKRIAGMIYPSIGADNDSRAE